MGINTFIYTSAQGFCSITFTCIVKQKYCSTVSTSSHLVHLSEQVFYLAALFG